MRWQGRDESSNIEDRRGKSGGGGGGIGLPTGKFGLGAAVVLLLIGLATGTDLTQLLGLTGELNGSGNDTAPPSKGPPTDDAARFIAVVLADTEVTWTQLFAAEGKTYAKPKLVLFDDSVDSACGHTSSAVGPFYCPGDRRVYLDLAFFNELSRRLGAPGDFAQAYVVGHEVGHHIQNLLGTSEKVHRMRSQVSDAEANQLSVRQELQADCYAGVWGFHANRQRQVLEVGDIEEALTAAAAIGDDQLQKQAGGAVRPESWTHGSSAQRTHWFKAGMASGQISTCDTFAPGAP
jgi:predicted metalloprotease